MTSWSSTRRGCTRGCGRCRANEPRHERGQGASKACARGRGRCGASPMRIVAFLATCLAGFALIAEPPASFAKIASAIDPDLVFIGLTTFFLAVNARLIILARATQRAWARSCLWVAAVALA